MLALKFKLSLAKISLFDKKTINTISFLIESKNELGLSCAKLELS